MAEWYEGLEPELLAHAELKGWKDPDPAKVAQAVIKAHFGAEKLIGVPADQVVRLPKDAADPAFQTIYDRVTGMATPTAPEGYVFGEGTKEEDAAFVRKIAVEQKLSIPAARAFAAGLSERATQAAADAAAKAETTKASNRAALMAAWGSDFDRKSFSALNALEAAGLPKSIIETIAALPPEEYKASMNAVVALGEKMGEAAMLRGGGRTVDPTAGMDAAAAQAKLNAYSTDKAWGAKLRAGDVEAMAEWNKLCTIVAAGRVAPR